MRILFDQSTPVPLRRYLIGHSVDTAFERGGSDLQNGELLDVAEQIVLLSTSWPRIQVRIDTIQAAVAGIVAGACQEISV
jgi:hypothetical protein